MRAHPEGVAVIVLLPIGLPDESPHPKARKTLKEMVFLEEYGIPF